MSSRTHKPVHEPLEPLILVMRNQRVILDADLARLYGVTTKRFNEAFKRNQQRFPDDFAFQLTAVEFNNLRSQIATSSLQAIESTSVNRSWSQSVTSSHGGRRYRPWAFTEHGAVMAANILRSERAIHMSVFVVRACGYANMSPPIGLFSSVLPRLTRP